MTDAPPATHHAPPARCQRCGCTEESPCIDAEAAATCGWIDAQEDLCSRCASLILSYPILPIDLAEACLVIRALRAVMVELLRAAATEPGHRLEVPIIWTDE